MIFKLLYLYVIVHYSESFFSLSCELTWFGSFNLLFLDLSNELISMDDKV